MADTVVTFDQFRQRQVNKDVRENSKDYFVVESVCFFKVGEADVVTKHIPNEHWNDFSDYFEIIETYHSLGSTGVMIFYKVFTEALDGDKDTINTIFDARTELDNMIKQYQTKFIELGYFTQKDFIRPWKWVPNKGKEQ